MLTILFQTHVRSGSGPNKGWLPYEIWEAARSAPTHRGLGADPVTVQTPIPFGITFVQVRKEHLFSTACSDWANFSSFLSTHLFISITPLWSILKQCNERLSSTEFLQSNGAAVHVKCRFVVISMAREDDLWSLPVDLKQAWLRLLVSAEE